MLRLIGRAPASICQRRTRGLATGRETTQPSTRPFAETPPATKAHREYHALAARRRHLPHGLRRRLRNRGHHPWRGLRPWHRHPPAHANSLEHPHRSDGWRTRKRASPRGRLLRLGSSRHGKFLGISGSVALARRKHFRYGDLSHPFRRVSRTSFSLDSRRAIAA